MALTKLGSVKAVTQVLVTSANLASEVTGILPVPNGGTGQSTFTDGQLLIGSTTGNTLAKATLTQGAGIAITNGGGSITVAVASTVVRTDQVNTYSAGVRQVFSPDSSNPGIVVGSTATDPSNVYDGGIWYNSTSLDLKYGDNSVVRTVANTNETQTFTNKTINGNSNTLTVLAGSQLTGAVGTGNGGLGVTTTPSSGFIPIGNGSGYTVQALGVSHLPALNGFTNATPALDDVAPFYDTSAAANRDATIAELIGIGVEGFIQGCKLEYLTTTSIRVTPGMAYIQSSGKILKLAANDDTSPSLSASTWYHVYLYDNSGTTDTEVSTTAPAASWIGTAKSKSGDTSRRYLGSFRTNSSSEILNFIFTGSGSEFLVLWRNVVSNTMRAVSAGTATTNAGGVFSVANMCPSGVRNVYARFFSNANQGLRTDADDMTGTDPDSNIGYVAIGTAGGDIYCPHSINSSQEMRYAFAATVTNGGGFYCDIYGYFLER